VHNIVRGIGYNLQPWARQYIKKHPEILSVPGPERAEGNSPGQRPGKKV